MRTTTICLPWLLVALSMTFGCGAGKPETPPKSPKSPTQEQEATGKQDALATVVAKLRVDTIGPYIGYGQEGALMMYAPLSEDGSRRWLMQALNQRGVPIGGVVDVGPGPQDAPFAVVRAVGEGYVALWVRQVHRADVLETVSFGPAGSPVSTIHTVTQAQGEVVWADALGGSNGTLVVWAEQSGHHATLKSVKLEEDGSVGGGGEVLVEDARAWDAVELNDGVALALVVSGDQDPSLGSVVLLILDSEGKAKGPPIAVSRGGSARMDVSMVRTRRGLLMAWTERTSADSWVHAAATDLKGRVIVAPRTPLPPHGDQALVALVAPSAQNPDRALLVYEELPFRGPNHRELRLVTLSAEAVASDSSARLTVASAQKVTPDFESAPDGFVLLTQAQACPDEATCKPVPWYVRLGTSLTVEGGRPLLSKDFRGEPPSLVWSPGCIQSNCLALAAGGRDPTHVVTARLPKGTVAEGVPVEPIPALKPPRPLSNRAVHVSHEPLSSLDVAKAGGTTFVGWVSHFVEGLGGSKPPPPGAPGDPRKPTAAHLGIQRLDPSGQLVESPTLISVRAISAGGVALAPSTNQQEVCVAWAARDNTTPQVFLTRVGTDGKPKLQRMITRSKGDVADIAITPHGDGWIVAWVDWRDGNGEVYVTRVNSMLIKQFPEKRITNAPGDASAVSLLVVDDEVLVAYGDSRDHPTHEIANPYVQRLRISNLERVGEESRIDSSEFHTKSVQLSRSGQDLIVGWLTQTLPGSTVTEAVGARLSRLEIGSLRRIGEGVRLRIPGSSAPISARFTCEKGMCYGAFMVPASAGVRMEGFTWHPKSSQLHRGPLAHASGAAAADVVPAVLDDTVFFVGKGIEGEDRIRQVRVQWSD